MEHTRNLSDIIDAVVKDLQKTKIFNGWAVGYEYEGRKYNFQWVTNITADNPNTNELSIKCELSPYDVFDQEGKIAYKLNEINSSYSTCGTFYIDTVKRHVMYRSSIKFYDSNITETTVKYIFDNANSTVKQYGEAIVATVRERSL